MAAVAKLKALLGLDTKEYRAKMRTATRQTQGFKTDLASVGAALGAAFSIRAITQATRAIMRFGSTLSDLADRAGVSTDTFQALEVAAIRAGSSPEKITNALSRLAISVGEAQKGTKTYVDWLKAVGVEVSEVESLSMEEIFTKVARTASTAARGSEEFAAAMQIIGARSGKDLIEVLRSISDEGLPALMEQAKKAGQVMDAQTVASLDRAEDALQLLGRRIKITAGGLVAWVGELFTARDAHTEFYTEAIKAAKATVDVGNAATDAAPKVQELTKAEKDFRKAVTSAGVATGELEQREAGQEAGLSEAETSAAVKRSKIMTGIANATRELLVLREQEVKTEEEALEVSTKIEAAKERLAKFRTQQVQQEQREQDKVNADAKAESDRRQQMFNDAIQSRINKVKEFMKARREARDQSTDVRAQAEEAIKSIEVQGQGVQVSSQQQMGGFVGSQRGQLGIADRQLKLARERGHIQSEMKVKLDEIGTSLEEAIAAIGRDV